MAEQPRGQNCPTGLADPTTCRNDKPQHGANRAGKSRFRLQRLGRRHTSASCSPSDTDGRRSAGGRRRHTARRMRPDQQLDLADRRLPFRAAFGL